MIKESGRDFKLFLLQGNPVEWNETIRSLNLGNHKNFENVFIQIYGEKLTVRSLNIVFLANIYNFLKLCATKKLEKT